MDYEKIVCNMVKAKEELNQVLIDSIEKTIKIADKYGLDRNMAVKQMGEKIYLATEMSDFKNYKCKGE